MTMTPERARELIGHTPGPWQFVEYDAGDCSWYDHNGPCPSIQAPETLDYAIVHWDGFKQQYWSACDGNQRKIEANARLIAAAPDLLAGYLALVEENERLRTALASTPVDTSRGGIG